jgi:hypothetical protein
MGNTLNSEKRLKKFSPNQKNFEILVYTLDRFEMIKKTFSRYCPFKGECIHFSHGAFEGECAIRHLLFLYRQLRMSNKYADEDNFFLLKPKYASLCLDINILHLYRCAGNMHQ